MPKIQRIRIAGLKYDGMQKQYKDTIFEFHNEETSTNGLISMMNGGGKGVLLQTIFQILKPGTSWGKQNNRYYQQFFFNHKEQFIPYTFHVAIEWELDGSEHRHLVTGGMFSAEQRISMQDDGEESKSMEQEAKIMPDITFYTREFASKEEVSFNQLPLFEDGESADSLVLKDYLKWNGYDVYRDFKKHYRILDTYGINRKDWDIMKEINKDEGGVGKYFEGAEDDHSLFKKRIIPTISAVLQRTEQQANDLVEIFKSQASIAKDLPILLKREQAHKEFLENIIPFETDLEKGIEHKDIIEKSMLSGRQLLGALEHVLQAEKHQLVELEAEKEKLLKRQAELRFEKDNLEYASAHREMMDWEKKLTEEKEKHVSLQAIVLEKQERKELLAFQVLWKEWHEIEQTIRSLSEQIHKLEQNSGLEHVNEQMDLIKQEAKRQWETANSTIQMAGEQHAGYQKLLKNKLKEQTQQEKKKTAEIAQLTSEINHLHEQIKLFQTKEEQLLKEFGDRLTYDLQGLLDSFHNQIEDKKAQLEELDAKTLQSIEKQTQFAASSGTIQQSLQFLEDKLRDLNEKHEKQKQTEQKLLTKLTAIFGITIETLTPAQLSKYMLDIEELVKQTHEEGELAKKALWATQLDHSLNDERFWIANNDLKELKEWIDEKTGIDVFYGTQFLQSLSADAMADYLSKFPLLPYGLIVSRAQWQKINQQLLSGRMFKSPVPIFLREEMNKDKELSFVLINGAEQQLLLNEQHFLKWKDNMGKEIESKKEALGEIEKTEHSLLQTLKNMERTASGQLSIELEKDLSSTEKERSVKLAEQQKISADTEKEKQFQRELKALMEKTKEKIVSASEAAATLKEYKQEKKHAAEQQVILQEKTNYKEACLKQQEEIVKELQGNMDLQSEWKETFFEWKLTIEQNIKEIAIFIEEAAFPSIKQTEATDAIPALSLHILDDLNGSIEQLKNLQKSKEEQAKDLSVLQTKVSNEQKQQKKIEKKLQGYREDWKDAPEPEEPANILDKLLQTAQKEAKEAEKTEREQEKAVTIAQTSLEHAQTQREKAEKKTAKHERQPERWEDIDLTMKEAEIKDQTKLTKDALKQCEKQQKHTEKSITEFEGDLLTLSVILKEESAPFTEESLDKIKKQGKKCVLSWCDAHQEMEEKGKEKHAKIEQTLRNLKLAIEGKDWEIRFKNEVLTTLDHMDTRHYEHIQTTVVNMKKFSQSGLEQLERDKERAENAQNFWTSRAAMKVISIADAIHSMIAKMKFKNERGTFPLVILKEDILPKKAEAIEPLLKQHFVSAIKKITEKFEVIDDTNRILDEEIKQLISDEQILFVALRNRYPELLVYNMRTDNAFMYGKPQKEHYSTWKTINQGSRTKSDGSGGQKLSARMVMMMMLLSVKGETDDSWVPLVCDNPFGQAASAHVLDPIFAVAEKLKFQFIVVTPPELVKTEISQRFEAYYKLDFTRDKGKEIVTDTIVPAFRIYLGDEVVQ